MWSWANYWPQRSHAAHTAMWQLRPGIGSQLREPWMGYHQWGTLELQLLCNGSDGRGMYWLFYFSSIGAVGLFVKVFNLCLSSPCHIVAVDLQGNNTASVAVIKIYWTTMQKKICCSIHLLCYYFLYFMLWSKPQQDWDQRTSFWKRALPCYGIVFSCLYSLDYLQHRPLYVSHIMCLGWVELF